MEKIPADFLFPYEAIPPQKKIILYGAGNLGYNYMLQMLWTGYEEVIGFIDKNYKGYSSLPVPVHPVEAALELEYDYLVIALADLEIALEVRKTLIKMGVNKNKIVVCGRRPNIVSKEIGKHVLHNEKPKYAFEQNELSIAFVLSPGLGDQIVMKKLVLHLISLAPDCSMDIWGVNAEEFVPAIYSDVQNVYSPQKKLETKYKFLKYEYALAIRSDYIVHIDVLNEAILSKRAPALYVYAKELQEKIRHNEVNMFDAAWRSVFMNRAKYKRNYIYNAVYHMNEFALPDNFNNEITIPLCAEYEQIFNNMHLGRFITLNFGNGQKSESAAKQWPYEYFCRFVKMFKKEFPGISVVQLGRKEARKISECDAYCLGENLELVKYVLKNSLFHLDIEGGLVHLATHLGTKCVVIFGPTMATYFGYAQNINIISDECNGCAYLYGGGGWVCARDMDKPICMYSITPEMVMQRIEENLSCKFTQGNIAKE